MVVVSRAGQQVLQNGFYTVGTKSSKIKMPLVLKQMVHKYSTAV
eukprot:SAG11_NODE_140_length_15009_cov_7.342522_12_plen_44_part_00